MNLSNIPYKKLLSYGLVWIFLNILLNIFGLWLQKFIQPSTFTFLSNISIEFIQPILFQSGLYLLVFMLASVLLKNQFLSKFLFAFVQVLIFHIVFVTNLKFANGIYFESTFSDLGVRYISMSGQYLVDTLYLFFPLDGKFDGGQFAPSNTGAFYFIWIFATLIYYFFISLLSDKLYTFLFNRSDV